MPQHDHTRFMRLAIEEGRKGESEGNRPIGSVIVSGGRVVGVGRNTVESECDPTNHAETVAIREACGKLGVTSLDGATLYTTMEPCPMCQWAIVIAGISELVLGARHADFAPHDYGDYSVERLLAMTGRRMSVVTGILQEECITIRRQWMARQAG
jgi:tRNA(Arg) A34 adenosine deaminase TadA